MCNFIVGLVVACFPFAILLNTVEFVIFAFYKAVTGRYIFSGRKGVM